MKIFHLTDLHFGNEAAPFSANDIENALLPFAVDFRLDTTYLVVTGDVTYKGKQKAYDEAAQFFKNAWLKNGGDGSRFIACPGNHDICDNKFTDFDTFQYSVRRDQKLDFEKANAFVLHDKNCVFAVINSAHHRNQQFGLVDVKQLDQAITQADLRDDPRPRIAVIHHHVIGVEESDLSTIKNALPLLHVLQENHFSLLLHGHRHALSQMLVGPDRMQVQAGRSLAFTRPGYVNGMTVHERKESCWQSSHYFLSKDMNKPGKAVFAKQGSA